MTYADDDDYAYDITRVGRQLIQYLVKWRIYAYSVQTEETLCV